MKKGIRLGLLAAFFLLCLSAGHGGLFAGKGRAVESDEVPRNTIGIPLSCRTRGGYIGSDQPCRSVG